ncbi:MAG: rhodanese-like domain-containing protein [Armatimonadetes bacterium]|nr:rhodanese-like domain-containing protein [Armatimonadota bacterium]
MENVTPLELKAEMDAGRPLVFLDVREAHELENGVLPGIVHIRMAQVPLSLGQLDKEADLVVVCRTGNRSGKVTDFLSKQGFTRVRNLDGGMNAWARDVDPSVNEY